MSPAPVKIAFGIMTATENPAAVAQLVDAIGPDYPIFVHHDYSKQPDFRLAGPNVTMIENPCNTGWGTWGFVQGVRLLMKTAFERSNCDYFQLLSGTCLPIRPIHDLAGALAVQTAPVNADMMNLDESLDAMMSFGFRVFTPENSAGFRVLRRLRGWYFGPEGTSRQIQHRSLSILRRPSGHRDLADGVRSGIAGWVLRAARRGLGFSHPFARESITPYVGSTWFGCRRDAAMRFLARPEDGGLERFTSTLHACDEIYLSSALRTLDVEIAPSNHYVSRFEGQHPKTLTVEDLPAAYASGRYFARKFSNDPRDPARQRALQAYQAYDFRPEVVVDASRAT